MAGNNPNAEHQRFIDSQPGNTLEQRENAAIEVLRKEMDTTLRSFNQTQNTIANYFLDGARGEKSIDNDTYLSTVSIYLSIYLSYLYSTRLSNILYSILYVYSTNVKYSEE